MLMVLVVFMGDIGTGTTLTRPHRKGFMKAFGTFLGSLLKYIYTMFHFWYSHNTFDMPFIYGSKLSVAETFEVIDGACIVTG